MAVDFVGIQTVNHLNRIFQLTNNHDFTLSSDLEQAVSAFKRSGHARFRRGPPVSSSDPQTPSVSFRSDATASFQSPVQSADVVVKDRCLKKPFTDATASCQSPIESADVAVNDGCSKKPDTVATASFQSPVESVKDGCLKRSITDATASFQSPTSSFASSFAGGSVEGSVSNGRKLSSLGVVAPAPSFSSRKPPLPSSHRKRLGTDINNNSVSTTACHCCKRRKTGSKRKVRRIPITGSKVESIPADDYSWKKYGEKKVHGSPFPRVYYKCNSGQGCPARKSVELSLTDSKMLIVTYDREHRH